MKGVHPKDGKGSVKDFVIQGETYFDGTFSTASCPKAIIFKMSKGTAPQFEHRQPEDCRSVTKYTFELLVSGTASLGFLRALVIMAMHKPH
jgi:hypothetical protein